MPTSTVVVDFEAVKRFNRHGSGWEPWGKGMRTIWIAVALVLAAGCFGPGSGPIYLDTRTSPDARAGDAGLVDELSTDIVPDTGIVDLEPGEDLVIPPDLPGETGPEVGPFECLPGEGCFLEPCTNNSKCFSGWCVDHLGERICSRTCDQEDCPDGWACEQLEVSGGKMPVCVSNHPTLCRPCMEEADCLVAPGAYSTCLDFGSEGKFCGGACSAQGECPEGYLCQDAVTIGGVSASQCLPATGTCDCSAWSVEAALSTDCFVENDWGDCAGSRFCSAEGLTPCDAQIPAEESCNGLDDNCDGGTDEGPAEKLCDDDNPCTKDTCQLETGCHHETLPEGPCDDGNPCTEEDICLEGSCGGTPVDCDDADPCTDDFCDETGCQHNYNMADCDDGNACTSFDRCEDGACLPGAALKCDDENICTDDSCAPATGCVYEANENDCDDMNLCTVADKCTMGQCMGSAPVNCEDDNPCTDEFCDLESGCLYENNADPCDDSNPCTVGDQCAAGLCQAGEYLDCDDNDVCTKDSCVPGEGCVHQSWPQQCEDGNPCTEDSCNSATGCVHQPKGGYCNDLDACTEGGECANGVCVPGPAVNCNDNNWCTDDYCDNQTGCQHDNNSDLCPAGQCVEGECVKADPTNCDDWNPCTDDTYDQQLGCIYTINQAPCSDDNICTTGDHCEWGWCVSTDSVECDDGNVCTADICNPAIGCTFSFSDDECDDGNICTNDLCDAVLGCYHEYNNAQCDDGNPCTGQDVCLDGGCTGGPAVDCDDENICTDDSCNPVVGCVHTPNYGPCDDDNLCTDQDICLGAVCKGGLQVQCHDENPCTDDSCDPGSGCVFTTNVAPCDDEDLCTLVDFCQDGQCVGEEEMPCDDGNECTDDICESPLGCTSIANNAPCPGGVCANGECIPVCLDCCNAPYLRDNFQTDKGWQYGPEWQRAPAQMSFGQSYGGPDPGADHTSSLDNFVAGVNIGGNAGTMLHDFHWLTSPPINTLGAGELHLTFWRWLNSDYVPYIENAVQVYDGNSWQNIWTSGGSPGIQDSNWVFQNFNVTPYSNAQFRVRFGFNIGSAGVFNVASWNVDDVTVVDFSTGIEPPLCCAWNSDCESMFPGVGECQGGQCFF